MKLSVFTLNIWGLRLVSENRTERVKALANRLRNGEYDIVCLQELWCENDWRYLKEYCKTKFKYIHYFNSGMLGSGMCIMSCYPIIDIHYHSFILNGYLHMVMHGDWFGGKGVGLCRIDVQGFVVDVYTTHLHACYNPSNDKYIIHRVIQAFETANFIRITSNSSDLAILAGDINSDPNDICYKLISFGANMKDCYLACPSNSVKCTFSHPQNSYRNPSEGESRIDYILYKFNKKNSVSVKEHRYALPSRVPGQNFSYSDHESIEAVFEITANKDNFDKDIKINDNLLRKIELQKLKNDSLQICNENLVINQIISIRHFILFLILLIFIYWQSILPLSLYMNNHYLLTTFIIMILLATIVLIYSLVTKSIERNCVQGFCQQIEIIFS